jgi:hypothetical protein
MKSTVVWALAALNVLLLAMFVWRMTGETTAVAQAARPGDYLMIPGEVLGGNNAVVYVIDQDSRQLSAMSYDDSNKKLVTMPPINLDRFLVANARRPK